MTKENEQTPSEQDAAEFHWFVSSCLNWQAGYDLAEILTRMRKLDKTSAKDALDIVIYKVPGPSDAAYQINNYAPVVDGVECIGHADLRFEQ